MTILNGKGMFIWMLKDSEAGDMQKAADVAVQAGLTHVLIKVLDGVYYFNERPITDAAGGVTYTDDIIKPAIAAFKSRGLKVWGWQYVYLTNPEQEGKNATARALDLGLDGFVYDVEGECKGKPEPAKTYLAQTAALRQKMPVALSSFRWPSYHPELPWDIWLAAVDVWMPQVYWEGAHNAGAQLARSVSEYQALAAQYGLNGRQYFPTGAAYSENGWTTQPAEILDYLQTAQKLGLDGTNFWVWSHARRLAEGQWNVIHDYPWPGTNPTPPPPPPPPGPVPLTIPVNQFVINTVFPFMQKNGYTGPKPI